MRAVSGAARHLDGFDGFGDGADLIQLDQDGIAHAFGDAALQPRRVGDEQIVADELDLLAERLRQVLPAVPVVFGQAVFDGDDGILAHPAIPRTPHLLRACARICRIS